MNLGTRPLYYNEDGTINFRSLRRGWVDTAYVNGFHITLGRGYDHATERRTYYVNVSTEPTNIGNNRKFHNSLTSARTAFRDAKRTLANV